MNEVFLDDLRDNSRHVEQVIEGYHSGADPPDSGSFRSKPQRKSTLMGNRPGSAYG